MSDLNQYLHDIYKDTSRSGQHVRSVPWVKYEGLVWFIYGAITVLAIYDRFDWNVWPRQSFAYGPTAFAPKGFPGTSDKVEGYKVGPWSVVLYDVFARISGRFAIVCLNLLLVTQYRILSYFLATNKCVQYLPCGLLRHLQRQPEAA